MDAAEEIITQLEQSLQEATGKIDAFIAQQNVVISRAQADFENVMSDMEASIQKLKMEEVSVLERAAKASKQLMHEQSTLQNARNDLSALEVEASSLPAAIEASKAKETAAADLMQKTKEEYDKRENEVRYQLNELTKGISYYRRLGLDFERMNNDRLRLVFTMIDPERPEAKFGFSVYITPEETYAVEDCDPPLPRLEFLVAELNATNDFSLFVQTMRREFKQLVHSGRKSGSKLN